MKDRSKFVSETWAQLRGLTNPDEIIAISMRASVTFSRQFEDHHNAAELLMGAWKHLAEVGDPKAVQDFIRQMLELPNIRDMVSQSFFRSWLRTTVELPDKILDGIGDSERKERVRGQNVRLKQLRNTFDSGQPRAECVEVEIGPDGLSFDAYVEMSRLAYSDAEQETDGLGGLVALADTNAEFQRCDLRPDRAFQSRRMVFRNAKAMHLEEVAGENSIVSLAKSGVIAILQVRLG